MAGARPGRVPCRRLQACRGPRAGGAVRCQARPGRDGWLLWRARGLPPGSFASIRASHHHRPFYKHQLSPARPPSGSAACPRCPRCLGRCHSLAPSTTPPPLLALLSPGRRRPPPPSTFSLLHAGLRPLLFARFTETRLAQPRSAQSFETTALSRQAHDSNVMHRALGTALETSTASLSP